MKRFLPLLFILTAFWSCKSSRSTISDQSRVISDSTQYQILIIDPDFDLWYTLNFMPSRDYTDEYYRQWNMRAASNWNSYLVRGRYRRVITQTIYYSPQENYGIEVNRKLYWYFKYCEEQYRIPLLF